MLGHGSAMIRLCPLILLPTHDWPGENDNQQGQEKGIQESLERKVYGVCWPV